jgi:triosephosphate isomerase
MRDKIIAGNWKMFKTAATARELATGIARGLGVLAGAKVIVCPPFPYLSHVGLVLQGTGVALGAQNVYPAAEGPFTGEVSPEMLLDMGCEYVIVGHSERRQLLAENDEFINRKVCAALAAGLRVILCVGETLQQREMNETEAVLSTQLRAGLSRVERGSLVRLIIAYEPVWAIGTGRNATPEQAQNAHLFIRGQVAEKFGEEAAQQLPIQYGGSVKPDNARSLLQQPDLDGALVGGASLDAGSFLEIVRAAPG